MTKRRRNYRWVYWVIVLVLFAVAGAVGYKVWEVYFKDDEGAGVVDDGDSGSAKQTEKPSEMSKPESGEPDGTDDKPAELEKKTEQYDGDDPNASGELTGVVTYAGASGEDLVVRVNIDQYLTGGSCELRLVRDGATIYNSTVEIVDSAATATCKGFNVPLSGLGSGKIDINILLTAGEKTGIIKSEVNL